MLEGLWVCKIFALKIIIKKSFINMSLKYDLHHNHLKHTEKNRALLNVSIKNVNKLQTYSIKKACVIYNLTIKNLKGWICIKKKKKKKNSL